VLAAGAAGAAAGATTTEVDEETAEKKRNPWTWPLIILIAILAIVLIGTIIAFAMNGNDGKSGGKTTTTPPVSTSSTPTSAPPSSSAPTAIQIDRTHFIGMNVDAARAEIEALGLPVNAVVGAPATEPGLANTVTDVNPSGPVQPGTTITLTYYGDPEQPSAPSAAPTVTPSSVKAGKSFDVSWPAASCPAGQTLSGYAITVNGPATQPSPVAADVTKVTIATNDDATGQITVTYNYFCGQLSSPESPAATVTIEEGPAIGQ
jgi:serine/threonine-protein kinase